MYKMGEGWEEGRDGGRVGLGWVGVRDSSEGV